MAHRPLLLYTKTMRMPAWDADETSGQAWDGFVAFWVVFWVVVGAWTGYQIWQLTGLSASTVDSGRALQSAGRARQGLGDVPVIGDKTGGIGDRITTTAASIVDGGVRAGQGLRGLSVLIGLAVGIAPAGTVLVLYLPSRIARRREVAAVRTALHGAGDGGVMQALLARRAVEATRLRTWPPGGTTTGPGGAAPSLLTLAGEASGWPGRQLKQHRPGSAPSDGDRRHRAVLPGLSVAEDVPQAEGRR